MADPTAIIVTLQMEARAAERYTALRQAHFPPERNWLAAHLTLFHALPVDALDRVLADVADCAASTPPFAMRVDRVLSLGGGVAFGLSAPPALRLRAALAERWEPLLGRQDRHWHARLHVTVQNKVAPATARVLQAELEREFVPEDVGATGLEVWSYVGGPWRAIEAFAFRA